MLSRVRMTLSFDDDIAVRREPLHTRADWSLRQLVNDAPRVGLESFKFRQLV